MTSNEATKLSKACVITIAMIIFISHTFQNYRNRGGHKVKLIAPVCKNKLDFNFFTNRIVYYLKIIS